MKEGKKRQQESRVVIFVSVYFFKSVLGLELFHSTKEDGLFVIF